MEAGGPMMLGDMKPATELDSPRIGEEWGVNTVRRDPYFFLGVSFHALRFYAAHPYANPDALNPVDRLDWRIARDVLSESPAAVRDLFSVWVRGGLGLDEAATLAGARHHRTAVSMMNLAKECAREYAIRRGILWREEAFK